MLWATPAFWLTILAAMAGAYFIGAIPWALIVGRRFYGVDPREHGSGNLGATNVFRVLGARAGGATLLLDAAKGAVAVGLARLLVPAEAVGSTWSDWVALAAMMGAVLGHSYSPYIGFKGGKGVATSAGALAVLTPMAILIELLLMVGIVTLSRMVSLGSVIVALTYPPLVIWLYPDNRPLQVVIFLLAAVVVWRHRTNIVRIARGEERRLSLSKRGEALADDVKER